eukprot:Platyproteum_vivax@DN13917_c0_g1_i1.p1
MRTAQLEILEAELMRAVEVICGRLFWVSVSNSNALIDSKNTHYFCTDELFVYDNFNFDFGPLNLGHIHEYCLLLSDKLKTLKKHRYVHYCCKATGKRNNAAFLMCCYEIVCMHKSAEDALRPFSIVSPPLVPYRDAGFSSSSFDSHMMDCLNGLERAIQMGWYSFQTFDLAAYQRYSRAEEGDLTWLIPKQFLAFSSPTSYIYPLTLAKYINNLLTLEIALVIRLSSIEYNKEVFTDVGIDHLDLYVKDGSTPCMDIVDSFLAACDNAPGPIAVHCKAGLGRTGTLVGCYAIKNYKFPARWWIAWNRICRPGSILGQQQQYLVKIEGLLLSLGVSPECLRFVAGDETAVLELE